MIEFEEVLITGEQSLAVTEAEHIVLEGFSRERTSLVKAIRADRLHLMEEIHDLDKSPHKLLQEKRKLMEVQLEGIDKRLIRTLIFDF